MTIKNLTHEDYRAIFNENTLHRFNDVMAKVFYDGVERIVKDYDGSASKIWAGNPSSAAVVYRFLQFNGVGIKIATRERLMEITVKHTSRPPRRAAL